MPQTAGPKSNHQVKIFSEFSFPIATQRYIHIIAEPGGKTDVPAPPELRGAHRKIGSVEVLHYPLNLYPPF